MFFHWMTDAGSPARYALGYAARRDLVVSSCMNSTFTRCNHEALVTAMHTL